MKRIGLLAIAACLTLLVGCGGPVFYPVSGTVTLDGKPLPDATIVFQPQDKTKGHTSTGYTNTDGKYVLEYTERTAGTTECDYKVCITTYVNKEYGSDEEPIPVIPERVPAKYNVETTLVAKVTPEQVVFDFDLDSNGKIYQEEEE